MNEMNFQLQTEGGSRLYEQIYEHIKKEINEGKLLSGEKLPSTRFLAEYLQVSRSTVDYAYAQLLGEGYIEARACRGYFVCPVEGMFRLEETAACGNQSCMEAVPSQGALSSRRGRIPEGNVSLGADDAGREAFLQGHGALCGAVSDSVHGKRAVIDFSPYDIDMSGFPFNVWRKITKNILSYANSDLFARGEAQGDYELRRTISRYLHSSRGVNCRPEQIIVGAWNDYLLMLLEKILGRHVRIAMENPTYKRSYQIFRSFAYTIVPVDMDGWGMSAEKLVQKDVSVAYVMPSHQFPTGVVMPIGRRMELLKWADKEKGRYLIEDDYDSEFRYHGKPIPALQASDRRGRVIYMGTFSKAIAPAIRISFMVLPDMLLEKYLAECSFYSCTVSRIDQSILNEFIQDGYFERHLNKMRKIYKAKHDMLLECLQPLKGRFALSGENAGLHLVLTSKTGASERRLVQEAAEEGVRVYGLSESMMEEADSATVLLGFGGLTEEEICRGAQALGRAWGP